VTSLSAVTTTTLVLNTSPDTTLGTVDETTPSNDSTTTSTVLIETLTPDAETFEPEAPQAGFVTHEPNA
jgi:hypothetical protein